MEAQKRTTHKTIRGYRKNRREGETKKCDRVGGKKIDPGRGIV